MNLYAWLLAHRTKEELARELVETAKENAALRNKAGALETEIFWMKVAERDDKEKTCTPPSA